jgi:glycosyltransferase involved in cell wall biosynthesis
MSRRLGKHCYFIGSPGGGSAVARQFEVLNKELIRRGHEAKLISPLPEPDAERDTSSPANLYWPSRRPTRFTDAIFLGRLIRRHRPDCLVANFAAVNWMCLVGSAFRVKHRIAFYHTLSTQLDRDIEGGRNGLSRLTWLRKRFVYKAATAIVGNSHAALIDAQRSFGIGPEKCKLWRYSMEDPSSWLGLQTPQVREDVVVCAGRLSPSKGQDILLAALEEGLGQSATRVEFLGSGPMSENLRRMAQQRGIAGRCSFMGVVSNEEVLKRMSRAKITVVPSRNEAFGLVNIESMSVGTPVIASRVDGIPEIIRDGMEGYLVPPDNPKALAEKLGILISNGGLREELGGNARKRFLAEYEDRTVIGKQADWLEQVVQQPQQKNGH